MIVIMSLWRNDAGRDLEGRVEHLLSKTTTHGPLRWLWITGDNDDNTHARLRRLVRMRHRGPMDTCPVTILEHNTGIVGEDVATRRRRSSATATGMFVWVGEDHADDYAVLHESDLVTDVDIVDQLLASSNGYGPVAGWPMIALDPRRPQFYDVWAYRDMRGRQFTPRPPHAKGWADWRRGGGLIEVSSFGSVWLAPAALVRDRIITDLCVVELCKQWREEGIRLWVDPAIPVEQPIEHWEGVA